MTTTTTCHSDVVKLLTHLSAVQTGGQTLWLTARSPLRPRSPSWCCPCTSPPPTCTGRPHWTELKSKDKLVAKKSHWSIKKNPSWQRLLVTLCSTYRLRSTPRACSRRRSLCPGPSHHPSRKPQSGWQRCPTGTSGCFSPTEMCLSSSAPFQSTHLETHTGEIFQREFNVILENIDIIAM